MGDRPPALQLAVRPQQLNLGKSVFFENVVHVVKNANSTAKEVKKTIFHELYGHAATAALFGGQRVAKPNALLKAIGGGEGLYRLAAANKIDLHDYADGLAADTSLTDEQRRAVLMDELLAHMAEKKTVLRQKINESIGAVRAWLREHGFAQLAGYGNANLAHLLANVRKSLAAKATGKASMPVFGCDDQDVVGWTEKRIEYLLSARAPAGNHRAGRIVRTVISPRAGSAGRRRSRAKAASC